MQKTAKNYCSSVSVNLSAHRHIFVSFLFFSFDFCCLFFCFFVFLFFFCFLGFCLSSLMGKDGPSDDGAFVPLTPKKKEAYMTLPTLM